MDPPVDHQETSDPVPDTQNTQVVPKAAELDTVDLSKAVAKGKANSDLTIAFKDVSYSVQVPVVSESYETFISPLVNAAKFIGTCGKSNAKKTFYRAENISGVVKPGTMTLVIAPPGHGKSTYLKLLANRLPVQSGRVAYNGRSMDEAAAEGVDLKKMTQYVDQVDTHLPLLTVTETLDFAHKVSCHTYDPERVASTISLLGLDECKDTILGNAFIRGVSGGQKRRVTIGEMLVSDACALFLDEFTNGLDTATSEDIARGLRNWCDSTNGTIVSTLQQPTPGLYNTFDNVVILREGRVVFDGPREDVLPFFEAMGFRCPGDVDVCDFLIDVLSQPRLCLQRQRDSDKKDVKAGKTVPAPVLAGTFGADFPMATKPCVSTDDMIAYYRSTPIWAGIKQQLDVFFPQSGHVDTAKCASLTPTEAAKQMYQNGFVMAVSQLFKIIWERQVKVVYRDRNLVGPRLSNMVMMGLILGSLYYQVGAESFFLRCAVLLLGVAQISFGNMVELPIAVGYTHTVLKQMSAGFYPSWTYVCAAAITMIPLMLGEIIIFTNILYWMADNYASASCYFSAFAVSIVTAFCMSVWFRMLSSIGKDEASAHALAGPSTGVFMIFGGFFVSRSSMPVFMTWLYYLSPFSWATRALANIEFLSPRYDAVDNDGVRLGDAYMDSLDFELGEEWIGYAVLYLMCLGFIFMAIHALVLNNPYHEHSIGTRRTDDEELVESELDQEGEGALQLAAPANEDADAADVEGTLNRQESSASLVRDASSFNKNTLKTLREELPFHPTWLSFSDVKYTVQIQVDGQTKDKVLLDGVSGYAEPGKLTALMGASGAGKTTLLDVLAGRKSSGEIEGKILLNGRAPTPDDFASITGYVEQFDSLMAFDTVRETLQFAARLRLPASVSEVVKEKIVDEVLEILDLAPIQSYLIGNESVPGISPSQLKRVNIGVELVANPSVLFLDEPTTGLDSKAAQTVMRVVRRIARSGRSVVCTIHQPSAELFYLFDRLVLLGSGGHQIYFGDLGNRSARFIKYLQSVPGVKPIPARYNPASWMLEELGVGVAAVKAADNDDNASKESQFEMIQRFKAFYFKSRVYRRVAARLTALETLSGEEAQIEYSVSRAPLEDRQASYSMSVTSAALPTAASTIEKKDAPSMWYQYKLLQNRSFVSYWRNPPFLFMRTKVLIILSVLFGLIYLGVEISSQSNVISAVAARVMLSVFGGFVMASTALPTFLNNRAVFYRERASSMYAPGLWAAVGFVTECLIWVPIGAFVMQIPAYFMIGMKNTAGAFFQFYLALYLCFVVFISISSGIAAIAPTAPAAGIIQSSAFGFFINLNGMAIQASKIPIGWMWLFRALPLSHVTMCLLREQFAGNNNIIEIKDGLGTYTTTVSAYVSEYMGFGYEGYWEDIGWIILFIAVVQAGSFLATKYLVFSTR